MDPALTATGDRNWAHLIQKITVDPRTAPNVGEEMQDINIIEDPEGVNKILGSLPQITRPLKIKEDQDKKLTFINGMTKLNVK